MEEGDYDIRNRINTNINKNKTYSNFKKELDSKINDCLYFHT